MTLKLLLLLEACDSTSSQLIGAQYWRRLLGLFCTSELFLLQSSGQFFVTAEANTGIAGSCRVTPSSRRR